MVYIKTLLALSLGCLQLVHAIHVYSSDAVVNDEKLGIASKRQRRRTQDDILPVEYDPSTVYFRVQKPSLRSLSQPAQEQYSDFLRVLYQNDRTRAAYDDPYKRYKRDVQLVKTTLDSDSDNRQKRGIIFRPLFVYKEHEIRRRKPKTQKPVPKQFAPAPVKQSTAQIYQQAIMSGQRQQFAG